MSLKPATTPSGSTYPFSIFYLRMTFRFPNSQQRIYPSFPPLRKLRPPFTSINSLSPNETSSSFVISLAPTEQLCSRASKRIEQRWIDGYDAVRWGGRLWPLWALSFWGLVAKLREESAAWKQGTAWMAEQVQKLKGTGNGLEELKSNVRRVHSLMQVIPWTGNVSGFGCQTMHDLLDGRPASYRTPGSPTSKYFYKPIIFYFGYMKASHYHPSLSSHLDSPRKFWKPIGNETRGRIWSGLHRPLSRDDWVFSSLMEISRRLDSSHSAEETTGWE